MTAAIDITAGQRKTLLALLRRYIPGVAVWAYGSRVKWTARPNSDLDLVAFTTPEQQPLVSELKEALAESDLPFLVDLHVWDDVPERFHEIIRKEYVVLQEAKEKQVGAGQTDAWRESTWGEEISLEYGKSLRGYDTVSGQFRVFGSNGPIGWTTQPLANGPGVILGRKGAYRGVQYSRYPFFVIDTAYYVVPKTQLDMRWVYYAIKHHKLGEIDDGSPIPSTTRSAVYVKDLLVPPPSEQKTIAHILGTLDDKIELNQRMNATLEAMARALFQSWFVDFDPVRAKLDGRQPAGLDAATAALFPAHFQESPLGHIPQGWSAGTLIESFNLTMGQSPPGDTYNEDGEGIPFYQGRTDFGFRFPTRRIYCTAPTRYAKSGDTLVSVRAPVGDINMADEECCIGRGVAAVRHKSGAVSFTYHSMANLSPDFARFEAEGTVFGSINKQNFENLSFVNPPPEVVAAYEKFAAPLDDQIYTLEHQSRSLDALRDSLLPKLLSGELRVVVSAIEESVVA